MVTADRELEAPEEDAAPAPGPDDIVSIGAPEAPIASLDLAQRIGLQTVREAVAECARQLEAAQEMLDEAIRSVGLDPELDYPMDAEGHVFPGRPRGTLPAV